MTDYRITPADRSQLDQLRAEVDDMTSRIVAHWENEDCEYDHEMCLSKSVVAYVHELLVHDPIHLLILFLQTLYMRAEERIDNKEVGA